jgi:hypothetical protein
MPDDLATLEADLSDLCPAALDEKLLQRLEACTEGILDQLNLDETRLEEYFRGTRPVRLTPEFLASLEAIVHEVPFAVDEKIVLFPKAANVQVRHGRPLWGAAAAVALIGALSALLLPTGKTAAVVSGQARPAPDRTVAVASPFPDFAPASFNRGISEIRDEGVVWESKNQPQTRVRVVFMDRITLKDTSGRTIVVEQPRVEYMMLPAQTD